MHLDWNSLSVDDRIKSVVRDSLGFEKMTAVQSATVPVLLMNKDVSVEAVTGSGKTLAFLIPLVHYVLQQTSDPRSSDDDEESDRRSTQKVYAVIVSPTRELAAQTHSVLTKFTQHTTLKHSVTCLLFMGGCPVSEDESRFTRFGCHIMVSTPGRLVDLLTKCKAIQSSVRKNMHYMILDEADQLLEMGFERQISQILSHVPKLRRTGLFSATQTQQVEQLVRAGLRDPVHIRIKQKERKKSEAGVSGDQKGGGAKPAVVREALDTGLQIPQDLSNYHLSLSSFPDKLLLLIRLILRIRSSRQPQKVIVFFASCAQVDYFCLLINRRLSQMPVQAVGQAEGFSLLRLHRKLNQKRKGLFKQFTSSSRSVLLTTDVMARGIDVQNVQWVIHWDLPNSLQAYVHRSGRAGHQFGEAGNSLLLLMPHESSFLDLCHHRMIDTKPLQVEQLFSRISDDNRVPGTEGEDFTSDSLTEWIKNEARHDVDFYELGIQAFVSFIRTYSTKCVLSQSIFPSLDIIDVVKTYGLLKVPVMPEYRKRFKEYQQAFQPLMQPQDSHILNRFRDLLFHKNKKSSPARDVMHSFRKERQTKRQKTRNKINCTRLKGREKRSLIEEIEMRELADDARVVKKLKRGQISQQKFDEHFGV